MALRGIQEYIARDINNIARVVDEGNIVSMLLVIARKRKLVGRGNSN